ncbi:hypothetical protein Tco_0970526 [Tanacetum coccineum]
MWVKSRLPPPMPPKQRTMPGRPKGKRQKHPSEVNVSNSQRVSRFGRTITCSNCYQKGHNKKGCKNETIDPPPKEVRNKMRSYKCILGQMEQPVHMKEPIREANVQEHVNEDEDSGQNVQEEELVQEPANANDEPAQMEDNV